MAIKPTLRHTEVLQGTDSNRIVFGLYTGPDGRYGYMLAPRPEDFMPFKEDWEDWIAGPWRPQFIPSEQFAQLRTHRQWHFTVSAKLPRELFNASRWVKTTEFTAHTCTETFSSDLDWGMATFSDNSTAKAVILKITYGLVAQTHLQVRVAVKRNGLADLVRPKFTRAFGNDLKQLAGISMYGVEGLPAAPRAHVLCFENARAATAARARILEIFSEFDPRLER